MDEQLRQAVLDRLEENHLTCQQAHAIAKELAVEPLDVGRAADGVDVRISRCQLGLFGYGSKAAGTHKVVCPMAKVPPLLEAVLRAEASEKGIPCIAVWNIADRLGHSRQETSNAIEGLGLRVSVCQLGCFPRPGKGS